MAMAMCAAQGCKRLTTLTRNAMFARWSLPVFAGLAMAIGGLRVEGRIGLSPALFNSLAIART